jgi:hypothetical protein
MRCLLVFIFPPIEFPWPIEKCIFSEVGSHVAGCLRPEDAVIAFEGPRIGTCGISFLGSVKVHRAGVSIQVCMLCNVKQHVLP